MRLLILILFLLPLQLVSQKLSEEEIKQSEKRAKNVTIIRDNWGVPHIYGKTDADVVFGIMYAQCEDNFWQLEETYIRGLGRAGELYGEKELEADAEVRLFECVKNAKETYAKADPFVKDLCNAGAASINYYLYTHNSVNRRLLQVYEPWFFLLPETLSARSHGVTGAEVRNAFDGAMLKSQPEGPYELLQQNESGSNTFALAPSKTKSGHSMLLINPHVNLFGLGQRYEAHLVSEEGLNVSGFAMFGTFYIWSGFNQYTGWSHTNSAADFQDVYLEYFDPSDTTLYKYGDKYKKAVTWYDTVKINGTNGKENKVFLYRKTHHGPIVAKRDSAYVTIKNVTASQDKYILQCWKMMGSKNLQTFTAAMNDRALGYPTTSYADKFGNIAYWHGDAIPKRNTKFNWLLPVDGSDPGTEWKGIHDLKDIVQIVNPANGWIVNCNSTPFLAAGQSSPKRENYPLYMASEDQNFRAEEAIRLLSEPGKISFSDFEKLVVSNHLPMMADWLPQIINAYDNAVKKGPELELKLKKVVDLLRKWDYRYSVTSKETTLAVFWFLGYSEWARSRARSTAYASYNASLMAGKKLPAPDSVAVKILSDATDTLLQRFGTTFIAWGEINRLQRIHTSGTLEKFDDNKQSLPIGAVPSAMGSLFAVSSRPGVQQKRMYGVAGNSYSAIIEFGKKIKAKSIMYFGQSADPSSPHYFDQATLYAEGKYKEAYFYKQDVLKHAEKKYHPGEE